jgi:hypothetical protein
VSREVDACDREGFLGFYPVGGKRRFNLVTAGVFSHLARKTSVQHLLYGLTCTQYPELFSQFRQNDPNSQVMKSNVRVPNQQVNKVVCTIK